MTIDLPPRRCRRRPTSGAAISPTCRRATAETLPLETQGRLVRVTGLVLEAAGIRVPVGSVCEIHQDGRAAEARRR